MMRWPLLLVAMALSAPNVAHASLGKQLERYIVLREPSARLPDGASLIRARLVGDVDNDLRMLSAGPAVRILAGPGGGRILPLRLRTWGSCSRWIEKDRTGYVVGWVDGPRDKPISVEPLEYRSRIYLNPDEENSIGYKRTEVK